MIARGRKSAAPGGEPGLFFLLVDLADGGAEAVVVIGIIGVEAFEFLEARIVFFEVDLLDVEGGGLFLNGGFCGSGGLLI